MKYYIPVNGIVIECTEDMYQNFQDYYLEEYDFVTYLVARRLTDNNKCYRVVNHPPMNLIKSFDNIEEAYEAYNKILKK